MNIVLINLDGVVNSFGGVAKVFTSMANNLVQRGHNVTLLTYETKLGEPAFKLDSRVIYENCGNNIFEKIFPSENIAKLRTFYIRSRKERRIRRYQIEFESKGTPVLRALNRIKPDVIVAFQQEVTYLLIEVLKIKTPVVTMIHNTPAYYFDRPEFDIFKPALEKCACVQVLIPQFIEECRHYFSHKNIVYIPNVVDQSKQQSPLNTSVIINVGKLSPRKRQHLIVEAFSKLENKYPQWSVEFWGWDKTEYASNLKKRVRELGLEKKIKFCGETREVSCKLQNASIFIFPSILEGFGLACAEAMSAGLPTIGCRDCQAISSLIKDNVNGLLADGNAEDLTIKLEMLMHNADLRIQLGNNAHKSMQQFAPEVVWNQWDTLLRSLAE